MLTAQNKRYFHLCQFDDLCQYMNRIPHCKQFIHHQHDVPNCRYDTVCRLITDPVHHFSYRHTDLPDLFFACRNYRSQKYRKKVFS